MKPRIGITCDTETITDRRGHPSPRFVSPTAYSEAVERAGGTPLLFTHLSVEHVPSLCDAVHGLVVSGGDFDVPPSYYGQTPRPGLGTIVEGRSEIERALIQEALRRNLPILGVCGGIQLLNVVLGGTLFQDLKERPGTGAHEQPHDKRQPSHPVHVTSRSKLFEATGSMLLQANSTHHQIIDKLGEGVHASGLAPDGVVEAIEVEGRPFVMGVQWHPELLRPDGHGASDHDGIYRALIAAAQKPSK